MQPSLGLRVRPISSVRKKSSEWDGVIVKIVQPADGDHGYVATWLENKINYGDDNCEHYAYYDDEQLSKLLVEII